MSESLVLLEIRETTAMITLNRPQKKNALSRAMLEDLRQTLDDLHPERQVRAVILAASGDTFCAGLDLAEMHANEQGDDAAADRFRDAQRLGELFEQMLRFPKVLICAVNGAAVAAGAGLALACDIVVGNTTASLEFPETRLGLVAGLVAPLLVFRAGGGPAGHLLLSGRSANADAALRLGLIQEIANEGDLLELALAVAEDAGRGAPEAIQSTKRMLNETIGEHLSTLFSVGAAATATARSTEAAQEGLSAFLEKRPPVWP